MDCHLKGGVLALQALLVVVLRELHRNFKLLAGVVAHKLVLKAGDKLVGTQHQGVLLSLAAGEGHPIQEAFEVDFGGVAVFGGAVVHIHQTAVAVRHAVQLGLDLLLGDGAVFPHRLQALIFPQGNFGAGGDLGYKGVALAINFLQLHIGPVHRLQAGFLQGLLVGVGIGHIDGVLIEIVLTHHPHHHCAGSLALAEAGNIELRDIFAEGAVQTCLPLVTLHMDLQLVKVGLDLVSPEQFHVTSSRCYTEI